ncbi:MAG: efflux RND transporter periplasmic adaptor subunit [Hyphomonadaceae bacterium]|nr:efflux RND transporter periplasmic adaptor subunit [Hyphomonadaceae bacterium]
MKVSPKSVVAMVAIGLVAIVVASMFAYWSLRPQPVPQQVIYGSGRIEADEVRIGVEVAGRLLEVNAVEGASIEKGALVARIDEGDYTLQAEQAAAQRTAAQRAASKLAPQIDVAKHHAETAKTDLRRFESLETQGAVSVREADLQRNANQTALNQVRTLQEQQAEARAQAEVASRSLALAQSRIGKTQIYAPISGAILQRLAQPGEVVAPGQAVAIMADLSIAKLKVFISERDLGKVRLGAPARIRVDAFPGRDFPARLARVDAQAQFTPRDVHMEDERSRTVFGVTLEASNPEGLLKPGMPADAWILWDEKSAWPDRLQVPE